MKFATDFAEMVLVVENVQVAAKFYEDVVGLTLQGPADETWAWFWLGEPDTPRRLALHKGTLLFEEHSPYPEGARWGRVHFALNVPRERLEDAVLHVRRAGVAVYGPTRFDWMAATSYYFYDPDGNLLEFWSPDAR
jgi:catechol-2,3-dioxygenase